jgi:hypothetical protein
VAGERASTTTQPQWQATTKNKSMWQMMRAGTKRARAARAMVMAMRVEGVKEGEGSKAHGVGNDGGVGQRGWAARAMVMRVVGKQWQ